MSRKSALINVMEGAVRKAARGLLRDFGEVENLQVSKKGPADFVSIADHKSERTLRDELSRARPKFGFRLEEGGDIEPEGGRSIWVVDPLDGTTNFLHGIPYFSISVAVEQDGTLIAGVVYNPVVDELFWAERGIGTFVNYRRLRVSSRNRLPDSVIATGIPHHEQSSEQPFMAELDAMMPAVAGIRGCGAASLDLAYVAAGRFDGFWDRGLATWDMAAGIVLVREAGGMIADLDGSSRMMASGNILASNDPLHLPLQKLLRTAARNAAGST
jgi:myo-inositol-1(or 4)-monophosphatase